jgi:hypothetical protein
MAVHPAHIREVRVFRESHGDPMRIVAAEIFGKIGARLFDGSGIRIRSGWLPLRVRGSRLR